MTDLYPYAAPDGLEMLIRWLAPLGGEVGPQLELNSQYPFRMVYEIPGTDDRVSVRNIYGVDTFATGATKAEALLNARNEAQRTHRRIELLGPPWGGQQRVQMDDGSFAFADEVVTSRTPSWAPYGTNELVARMVAHYAITLRKTAA